MGSKQTLMFRFHNPNTPELTADFLTKILIEANRTKADEALRSAGEKACESAT